MSFVKLAYKNHTSRLREVLAASCSARQDGRGDADDHLKHGNEKEQAVDRHWKLVGI